MVLINTKVPFKNADILLPSCCNMTKWSVVACDQYTSERSYWERAETLVGDEASTLKLIFPEVYLDDGDSTKRIASINETMQKYIDSGVFKTFLNSMVYVERTVSKNKIRKGIIGSVDLEEYDYHLGSRSLIRATEGTVLERIPPRVKIRENAPLELPHIMLLIDDPECTVIEIVQKNSLEVLYDFDLMADSGHIVGYRLDGAEIIARLQTLLQKQSGDNRLLFAVGDGNHSLATAKECWENVKKTLSESEQMTHPARYPLVELVNIHDASLEFEPIHRVVFDCDANKLIEGLKKYYPLFNTDGRGHKITYIIGNEESTIYIDNPPCELEVGTLQRFLDEYLAGNGGRIDYIHGDEVVRELSKQENTVGFLLPAMQKSQLFKSVIANGALPRKTFSMGEAWEKRFYLECRKIK